MTENYRYPNIRQSVWIVVSLIILKGVFAILFGILETFIGFPPPKHPAVFALINFIAFTIILAKWLKRTEATFKEICSLVPVRLSLLFPMTLTVIGTSILLYELNDWLWDFLPAPEWFADLYRNLVNARTNPWGSIAAFVVVGPVMEELLFRGLILRGFLSLYSARKAILASAILFGLLHLNPWQFISATIFGILVAWWFMQTHSIIPCLFGHALANTLTLSVIALRRLEIPGFTGGFPPLWFDFVGLVLAALGVWLLIRQFRQSSYTVTGDLIGHESDE